jgi:sulfide:quinone oxidoreductase
MERTLILGAGFGGLTVATELRELLGPDPEHEIVLVDRRPYFLMGLRKLWALVGLGSLEEGSRARERLDRRGLRFVQEKVRTIDPGRRAAETDSGWIEADHLVVALGAEPRPDLVPGLAEHGHNVWEAAAVPALKQALDGLDEGTIAIVIAGVPYTCPPAPYECAMLLDDHLREQGRRDRIRLAVATVQPLLMPNAGADGSRWLGEQLDARQIEHQTGRKVERVEADRVVCPDGELPFDLLIGVPPHRPPAVVAESGLTGEGLWVMVDPGTLRTAYEGVYAIGDVTMIPLANGLPLPKAGVMAELEGRIVASAIAAELRGKKPPEPFDGQGFCFMEMGKATATLIEGDFFAAPEPRIRLGDVSGAYAREKHRFEADRLARWFGGPA